MADQVARLRLKTSEIARTLGRSTRQTEPGEKPLRIRLFEHSIADCLMTKPGAQDGIPLCFLDDSNTLRCCRLEPYKLVCHNQGDTFSVCPAISSPCSGTRKSPAMTHLEIGRSDATGRPASSRRRVIVFELAEQDYALPIEFVQEIVHLPQLAQPPALPAMLAGMLNLAGVALPVVRLARLFGQAEAPLHLYTPLVIVRSSQTPLAFVVDSVREIAELDGAHLVEMADHVCVNDCAEGVFALAGRHVVLLAPDRVVREEERQRLADLADQEQTRLAELEESRP